MKRYICLILSLIIAFSLLVGCKSNEDDTQKTSSEQIENPNSNMGDDEMTEKIPNSSETDYVDTEQLEDGWTEDEEYNDEIIELDLEVHNSKKPITNKYHGFSSTIYHAFGYMKNDASGRAYTDKMLELELDRLTNLGVRTVRTRFQSQWVWSEQKGYDWNSERFGYFCDYAKALQQRNVDIILQVGWHFDWMSEEGIGSLNDDTYFKGYGDDLHGESTNFNFGGMSDYDARITKGARRYAHWIGESLKELRSRGINNIKILSYWVEPCNAYGTYPEGYTGDRSHGHDKRQYALFVRQFRNKLAEAKLDHTVDHMGPNELSTAPEPNRAPTLEYVLENDPDLFTIYSSHHYPKSDSTVNDVYYSITEPHQQYYIDMMKKHGLYGKKEFWMDEYNAHYKDYGPAQNNSWQGLQTVMGGIVAQQKGINNVILWQLYDQLWTDRTNNGKEWINGIHMTGYVPSLFVSSIPYSQYYPIGLFMKYNGNGNGSAIETNNAYLAECGEGVYVGAVKLENGKWTISVVNLNLDDRRIHVKFDKPINQTLYRHLCVTSDIKPTPKAELAPADKIYGNVQDKFTDIIPSGSIAIYTGVRG